MKRFSTFINELEESKKKLSGGQKALDKDNDGDIDGDDFAMMRKKKNEETDQLDELSPATLGNYVNKVNHERDYVGYGKKRDQRKKGVKTAISKLVTKAGGDKNEETEQLDELSPEKLGTYINKASDDASDFQNTSKRKKGIMRATKKLVTKAGGDKDQVTNY